ncbi:MAG: hypothetical protein BGP11_14155 [Rhodobacterales bacterium 65-51]|uniref:DUF6778 family protein n=1 Tax=uncultured Gemmobacter sp. TaxID=1095917 RepID=UPI000960F155|nr:DUF6778 family protein [uncultured Gemmobacter sp.]OJY27230.1 MAG: hypothetical protein BGP11_14155 [Rhodobacterales bacterium 65-51]
MKSAIRIMIALGLAFGLSACGGGVASRSGTTPGGITVATKNPVVMASKYDVQGIRVSVPRDLRVSEANMFYPIADIVWRGDVLGDRYTQVQAILEEGFAKGTAAMHQGPKVMLDVELTRFHSLTEKTRYTVGGVHSVHFILTVRDAATGAVIEKPRKVWADAKGAGGTRAIAEEAAGRTMRVVIEERLAEVIRQELSIPIPESTAPMSRNSTLATGTVAALY